MEEQEIFLDYLIPLKTENFVRKILLFGETGKILEMQSEKPEESMKI